MDRTMRRIFIHTGLFFGLLTVLYLSLVLSALIPNKLLLENFKSSALSYAQTEAFQFHNGAKWNGIADNYADAILLNVAWHMGEGNPFTSSVDTDYFDGGENGESVGLYLSVAEGAAPNTDYTRYWHGGAIAVRLCHLVTDVDGMKNLGLMAALVLLAVNAALLWHRGHGDLAVLLALSLAAVQVWNIRLSLEYQTAFMVTLALCPLYLILERKDDDLLTLLSVVGGVSIAFFDFLTTETLTILLPLILVTAVRAKEGRLQPLGESLRLMVGCSLCWGFAYAGTFLVKWTAATLVTGENAFVLAIMMAAERVNGAAGLGQTSPDSIFSAVFANLTVLFGGTERVQMERVIPGLAVSLGVAGSLWYLLHKKDGNRDAALLLWMLGSVVFVRYLVLNNHSYLHEFFTYRALAAPVLALLLAVRLNISFPEKRKARRR